ncbi:pilus assembly PilX family protein [Desulfonatronum parangueonense]
MKAINNKFTFGFMSSFFLNFRFDSERGVALITVLLFLAVMTFLGITAANISNIENLISSNYKTSKIAFYNADAGVKYAMEMIQIDINNDDSKTIDVTVYNSPDGFDFYFEDSGDKCFYSFGKGLRNSNAKIRACYDYETRIVDIFTHGIVSENKINISGHINMFYGSMHANKGITQTAQGSTDVTLHGSVTAYGSIPDINPNITVTGEVKEISEKMVIPKVTEDIFQYFENIAKEYNDNIDPPASISYGQGNDIVDLTDRVIFTFGDFSCHKCIISNTTIVAKGSVTFSSQTQWSLETVNNLIIADKSINFNGQDDAAGVFWSNGEFRHNGKNKLYGSVVTSGDFETDLNPEPNVTLPGNLKFDNRKPMDNIYIPRYKAVVLVSWADMSLVM